MSSCGWLAPVRPVLPDSGTIGVRVSAQTFTSAASSAVVRGLRTSGALPGQPSRQGWQ